MKRTVVLLVLDGWGIGREDESNPIFTAKPENFAWLAANYPLTSLQASGISVGLPWGETGNSEVGHLTMGAGKVLYEHFPRIELSIHDGSFFENAVLKNAFAHARNNNSSINFVGLLSKANTHASLTHLQALIKMAEKEGVDRVNLQLFTDGKDSPPRSAEDFLKTLPQEKLGVLMGRHYALDREEHWRLTEAAHNVLIGKSGQVVTNYGDALQAAYAKDGTEEYLPPIQVNPERVIKENDAVVFFNFREDGIKQLAESFLKKDFKAFATTPFQNIYFATMTKYEDSFTTPVVFPPEVVAEPLGKVLGDKGKTQLRLAETYKYAHITYFFNGYREGPFKNEYRVLVPSITTFHPEEQPKLMASAITDRLIPAIENQSFDFILVNYANADVIGHTGNMDAALETVKVLDTELGRILKVAINPQTVLMITGDHGNIENILDLMTGRPERQHDPSPVPFYLVGQEFKNRKFINWQNLTNDTLGVLSDIAPTILELLELPKPPEMTGHSLLKQLI